MYFAELLDIILESMNKKINSVNVILIVIIVLVVGVFYIQSKVVFPFSTSYTVYQGTPDDLKVSRSINPLGQNNNSVTFYKEVNDPTSVQELYKAILALPVYPSSQIGATNHCVMNPSKVLYELSFFKNSQLVQQGTITIIGCGGGRSVHLNGDVEREFYDQSKNQTFQALLEKSFGITENQLFGM